MRRWGSPAGFLLALLFFLLPFVAVSCDAGNGESFELSYSGLDLATGAKPDIEASGGFSGRPEGKPGEITNSETPPEADVQLLGLGVLALLGVGLALSLLPATRGRVWVPAAVAGAAAALLVVTEGVAMANLRSVIRGAIGPSGDGLSQEQVERTVQGLVQIRFGFWLTLGLLVLLALFNVGLMIYRRSRAGPVG